MIQPATLLRVAPLVAVLACSSPAMATDEDFQFYVYLKGSFSIAENVTNTTEISPRWREGSDILQLRTTFETPVADGLKLGAGGAYVESGGSHEIRPHQQIVYSSGPISARTKLEERFFEGADRVELRLRQNVKLSQHIAGNTSGSISGEALYTLQSRNRGNTEPGDQWRGEIGLSQHLSDSFSIAEAYRAIYTPHDTRSDTLNHIAILTLSWKP